jgi:hypothetical protein
MSPKQKPLKQKEPEVFVSPPKTMWDDPVAWVNSLNGWQYLLVCVIIFIVLGMVTGGVDQSGSHSYVRTP